MARVLVIGLDGGTFHILRPLADRGLIPNIGRLMDEGFSTVMLSTVPPVTAPAWTSFITGKSPGKHGIFQFFDLRPGRVGGAEIRPGVFSFVNARSILPKTLWQMANEGGKRVGVINVPMTYPPVAINGFMISGMLTPPGASDFTYPPELASDLGGYMIDLNFDEKELGFPRMKLIARQIEILEKRGEAAIRLMREHDWDLFMVVFTGTDRLQHRFWRSLDPQSPWYDHPQVERYRPALEGYYRRLDEIIGRLLEGVDEETFVLMISDHGFGPIAQKTVSGYALVQELLGRRERAEGGLNWALWLRALLRRVGLGRKARERYLGKILPKSWLQRAEEAGRRRAWAASKAYCVQLHEYIGGIWINLKSPQGRGVVEAGAQYETLRQRLMAGLMELVDPSDGTPLVERVYMREELYQGRFAENAPHLVFFLQPGYSLSQDVAAAGSLVIAKPEIADPPLQGTHRQEGIFVLRGAGTNPGWHETSCRIEDSTATTLYLLGLPVPEDLEGRVVTEAFAPGYLERHPLKFSEAEEGLPAEVPQELWESEEDQKKIEERLRGLGYL